MIGDAEDNLLSEVGSESGGAVDLERDNGDAVPEKPQSTPSDESDVEQDFNHTRRSVYESLNLNPDGFEEVPFLTNNRYQQYHSYDNSNFYGGVHGAEDVTINNFSDSTNTTFDPTYEVRLPQTDTTYERMEEVETARDRLLKDRIVFLTATSQGAITVPLYTLINKLNDGFVFRTHRGGTFDLDIYRHEHVHMHYRRPTVTYLNLFNAPCDVQPLLQAEYSAEVRACLKRQNNFLILVTGQEFSNDVDNVHARSELYIWEVVNSQEVNVSTDEFSLVDHYGATVEFLVAFFPGLAVTEIDRLVRCLTHEIQLPQEPIKAENEEAPAEKKMLSWDDAADEISRNRGIAYVDRDGQGVGYYFEDEQREHNTRALLLDHFPQFVHGKLKALLCYYFSTEQISSRFFYRFTDLLIGQARRRTNSLSVDDLLGVFENAVLNDLNELALQRLLLVIRELDRHPATRRLIDEFSVAVLGAAKLLLDNWDAKIRKHLSDSEQDLKHEDVEIWLAETPDDRQEYQVLIQRLVASYYILIQATHWKVRRRVAILHELTTYGQKPTHAGYITRGVGIITLYEYLISNWMAFEDYGNAVILLHEDKDQPPAHVFLDAFNLSVRQIVDDCVYQGDWSVAEGFIDQLASSKDDTLAQIIARIALAKAPYRPSRKYLKLMLTANNTSITIHEGSRGRNLEELAHFYEKLARALVKYTDERADFSIPRRNYLRNLIRPVVQPLMRQLDSPERSELREWCKQLQERSKRHRETHEYQRGSHRQRMQILIAEAMRILRGSLLMTPKLTHKR